MKLKRTLATRLRELTDGQVRRKDPDFRERCRFVLFLSLGLAPMGTARPHKGGWFYIGGFLYEPAAAKTSRRNILAFAGIVAVAGLMGASPSDLTLFGVKPVGHRGMIVVGGAVIAVHIYLYVQKYLHLATDGIVEQFGTMTEDLVRPAPRDRGDGPKSIQEIAPPYLQRRADLVSNWAAFVLTVLSWCFAVSWIAEGLAGWASSVVRAFGQ